MNIIEPGFIEINKDNYNQVFECERCRCIFEANENDAFLMKDEGRWVMYESAYVKCPNNDCDRVYAIKVSQKTFDNLLEKKYPTNQKQGWISWVLGLDQK